VSSQPSIAARTTDIPDVSFLWLELTGRCNLACRHCYAESGPNGTHGVMSVNDWFSVIDQATAMGVPMVQLIGGEPTLHPAFPDLLRYAVGTGLAVEVYSNLSRIKPEWWEIFSHPDVSMATSYYSDVPEEHDAITRRRGSHSRTLANIGEAVTRGIPLRVGIVDTGNGQRATQARAELEAIGVTSIGTDHMRRFGRAAAMRELRQTFPPERPCVPSMCDPQCGPNCSPACNPQKCTPTCRPQYSADPCSPTRDCQPNKCRPTK
jgi:MoaA/NifB/PqqE/SkfB family radical SAM enzyme